MKAAGGPAARSAAAMLVVSALVAGCARGGAGAASPARADEPPVWEREGLKGAVRPEMGSPQPGEAAPDFDLPALSGGTVRLSSLRGAWVVVHFTASWCPYCDAEISHLGEIARAYGDRNVKVVVVDLKEEPSTWTAYARERVAPELVALQDLTGSAAVRFAPPRAQPSFVDRSQVLFDATLVIDPRGVIRLFLLPDTAHFDPKFGGVRRELDRWVGTKAEAPEGDVLPPEKVVSLAGDARSGDAVVVRMQIAPGYHIMSNHPADEFAIPTRVRASSEIPGCEIREPVFPAPVVVDFYGKHLSTFEGALEVKVPIKCAAPLAKGLSVEVRYQACTASRCLAPVKKTVEVAAP